MRINRSKQNIHAGTHTQKNPVIEPFTTSLIALLFAGCTLPAFAAEGGTLYPEGTIDKQALEKILPDKPPYSPYADLNFPARPLFGDTHVHTSYSLDAGAAGARAGGGSALWQG